MLAHHHQACLDGQATNPRIAPRSKDPALKSSAQVHAGSNAAIAQHSYDACAGLHETQQRDSLGSRTASKTCIAVLGRESLGLQHCCGKRIGLPDVLPDVQEPHDHLKDSSQYHGSKDKIWLAREL